MATQVEAALGPVLNWGSRRVFSQKFASATSPSFAIWVTREGDVVVEKDDAGYARMTAKEARTLGGALTKAAFTALTRQIALERHLHRKAADELAEKELR